MTHTISNEILRSLTRALLISSFLLTAAACSRDEVISRPANPANLPPAGAEPTPTPKEIEESVASSKAELQPILDMGQKAVTWLNLVNSHRDVSNRLNLADKNTKNPVPPEKPNVTSVKLLLEKFNTRLEAVPVEMRPYLIEGKEFVEVPPVTDEAFIQAIRSLNNVYQGAVRWIGQEPWFNDYASNEVYDIRGIYFAKKDAAFEAKLNDFENQTTEDKATIKQWLISMCHNSDIEKSVCQTEVEKNETEKTVKAFFDKYVEKSKKTYDEFFTAMPMRKDISWSEDKTTVTQNFIDPKVAKVANWLKTNIEEEWQNQGFKLLLNFVEENPISPYLEFVKGVTPHVSGANWEKITMDPDYSLDDYNTQWTIRHEFGHVLGFPDCYLEFYNKEEKTMTYYTIEPDNLMCAWGGKLQPSHEVQLRTAYK